jgi:hypothetical protein
MSEEQVGYGEVGFAQRSAQIEKIAAALSRAQASMGPAIMNKTARVVGSTKAGARYEYTYHYADLDGVWQVVRKPLADNELSIISFVDIQYVEREDARPLAMAAVDTILLHSSGQYFRTTIRLTAKDSDPQSVGSSITYGKRYGLSALLGVSVQADDDGNAGQGNEAEVGDKKPTERKPAAPRPATKKDAPQPEAPKPEAAKEKVPVSENANLTEDQRRAKGLLDGATYQDLVNNLGAQKIGGRAWRDWLETRYGARDIHTALDITIDVYPEIYKVVMETPDLIREFKKEAK